MEYPKTENLFKRGADHRLQFDKFALPEFAAINRWRVTEKIDGMNMRIFYSPLILNPPAGPAPGVTYRGRTNNAAIPPQLIEWIQANLPFERLVATFKDTPVILFGEGYGGNIQKGTGYRATPAFRLFDIFWNDERQYFAYWREVQEIAGSLGIKTAPDLGIMDTAGAIEFVMKAKERPILGAKTAIEDCDGGDGDGPAPFEGIVAVADPPVFDRYGKRIKFKLKVRDL